MNGNNNLNVNPLLFMNQNHAQTAIPGQNQQKLNSPIPLSMLQILSTMNANQINPNVLKQLLFIQNLKNMKNAQSNVHNTNGQGMQSLLNDKINTNTNMNINTGTKSNQSSIDDKSASNPLSVLLQAVDALDAKQKNLSSDVSTSDDKVKKQSSRLSKKRKKSSRSSKKRKHDHR